MSTGPCRECFWGTPLPIWQCEQTGRQEAVASYAELLAKAGVQGTEVWADAKKQDPELIEDLKVHKPYIERNHVRLAVLVLWIRPRARGDRLLV